METDSPEPPAAYRDVAASVEAIPGFLVPGQEQWLFDKTNSLPSDAVIVEIGSLYGRSSCAMGFACVGTRRRVFCIDPWTFAELGDLDFFDSWRANIAARHLQSHVIPLRGRSHDVLARWGELTGRLSIDLLFIDGWHEHASVLRDFELAFPLVRPGGWIALHDVCQEWAGPLQAWNETAALTLAEHERCSTIACGRKLSDQIVGRRSASLAAPAGVVPRVHYFSEVGDGADLGSHLTTLRQLEFPWRWHVIAPGAIPPDARAIVADEPRVLLHAPKSADGWRDRLEALQTVLASITDECLLWRIDRADKWLPKQLSAGREMLLRDPKKTALAVGTPTGNHVLAWRCQPWFRWAGFPEPFLAAFLADGTVVDVGAANPIISHTETVSATAP